MIKHKLSKTKTLLSRTIVNRDTTKCRAVSIVGSGNIYFNIEHNGFKQRLFGDDIYPITDIYKPTYGLPVKANYIFSLKYNAHQNIQSIKQHKEAIDIVSQI